MKNLAKSPMRYLLISLATISLSATLLLSGCRNIPTVPLIAADISPQTHETASENYPVSQPIDMPTGLRACCAFGDNLRVQLWGVPLPFYRIDNVVDINNLGIHHYNDSFWYGMAALAGLSDENLGIIYTRKGGFIDIAHVRDTADSSYYLFTHIYHNLGKKWTLTLANELAERHIQFHAFTPPTDAAERYTLSVYLAARLGYQLAVWHEIAQWYGFHSVPGFSEEISAFTPEDLYSNLLGARLAISILTRGHGQSIILYNEAMQGILPSALKQLDAQSAAQTHQAFESINGLWWDNKKRVPEKSLVIRRDYNIDDLRAPSQPKQEKIQGQILALPHTYRGYVLKQLATFQLNATDNMANLPTTEWPITESDFPALVEQAAKEDAKTVIK